MSVPRYWVIERGAHLLSQDREQAVDGNVLEEVLDLLHANRNLLALAVGLGSPLGPGPRNKDLVPVRVSGAGVVCAEVRGVSGGRWGVRRGDLRRAWEMRHEWYGTRMSECRTSPTALLSCFEVEKAWCPPGGASRVSDEHQGRPRPKRRSSSHSCAGERAWVSLQRNYETSRISSPTTHTVTQRRNEVSALHEPAPPLIGSQRSRNAAKRRAQLSPRTGQPSYRGDPAPR